MPLPTYDHTSWGALKAELAGRLGDPSMLFYADAELGSYLADAMRMLGLATGFWRASGTIDLLPGVGFYDIATAMQPAGLADYTVTDTSVITTMQYMLCEPASGGGAWTGSDQFDRATLTAALQRARNQLLDDTMVSLATQQYPVLAGDGRVPLVDTVSAIRRAVWRNPRGEYSNLHWEDESGATAYNSAYPQSPGTPDMYSIMASPPLVMQLIPPPLDIGRVDLIVAASGADLDPTARSGLGVVLGLPDDTAWIARELALADLTGRDGPAADPRRSALCRARYDMGVRMANAMAQIVYIEIDGRPLLPSGLAEIDYAYAAPHWQTGPSGQPVEAGIIGGNLVAVRPLPDGRPHAMYLDVIRKAPVPTADTEKIQIGRELLSALLDGAEALAMWKLGDDQSLMQAATLTDSLIAAATRYNAKLSIFGRGEMMQRLSRLDESSRPERADVGPHGLGTAASAMQPPRTA